MNAFLAPALLGLGSVIFTLGFAVSGLVKVARQDGTLKA